MPEIDIIKNSAIPRIPHIYIQKQSSIPKTQHITRTLPPVFDMPCTTIRRDGTTNNKLFIDDPSGNINICPLPFYEPLNYNKKDLVIIEQDNKPPNIEPPVNETVEPKIPDVNTDQIPCPDPKRNNPRIGDLNSKGTEKVTGFQYIRETKECVVQWASTSATEKYLPSLNTVSTTFAITIVATTAATLTPFLTKLLKPIFKQLITKLKKLIGKKGTRFTGKKSIKSKLQ
tara:strand:+ start:232 stop:918 length:687 start_codon:yes stop_codon:yes gene_type:complete